MMFDRDGRCANPSQQNGVTAANIFGSNSGNVNVNSLLTWGMQNSGTQVTGNDNASGWIQVGQAMANGTLANPQYANGYTDQYGRNYVDFCYSCHDPNDPVARLKLGAAFNTVNTSIPAFLAQNALAFVPAEGMVGDVAMAGSAINSTAQTTFYVTADGTVIPATVYRVFGGDARGMGSFWTTVNPATVPNFRAAAGLPSGNAGTWVAEGQITSLEGATYGTAAPGATTQAGQMMAPQIQFQPGTASSQVNVNAVYNVQSPY
jgi:hypothetical protein